ncbi:hypothetical protein HAX54_004480, partial [Datura stramonium]|nr:hypothetical protein [Datura stramonium]
TAEQVLHDTMTKRKRENASTKEITLLGLLQLNNFEPYDYIDDNDAPELELNYFASIRFGYLPLRNGNSIIIDTYSPHRFSRQFGFYQRILAGPISTKISEVAPQGCSNATPKTGNSSAPMGESTSSRDDCYWKKVRSSNKSGDAELVVLEIPDSVDSPSRTLTVPFKQSNCVGALPRGGSQESGESVSSPNPIKLSSA